MTKKISLLQTALGLFAMAGMTATLVAQTATGTIRGTVLDPSGALIVRAQLIVTSASGYTRTLASDDKGAFTVTDLAPGSYSVSVDAAGFTPALEGVQVVDDRVAEETIKLGISVNQEIEVSASK